MTKSQPFFGRPNGLDNFAQQNLAGAVEAKGEGIGKAAADKHLGVALAEAQSMPAVEPDGGILFAAMASQHALSSMQVPGQNETIARGRRGGKDGGDMANRIRGPSDMVEASGTGSASICTGCSTG